MSAAVAYDSYYDAWIPRLGECLIKNKAIDRQQLIRALAFQEVSGGKLGEVLIEMGWIEPSQLLWALKEQTAFPAVDLSFFEPDPNLLKRLSASYAFHNLVLPLKQLEGKLFVAMPYPFNPNTVERLSRQLKSPLEPVIALRSQIKEAVLKHYCISEPHLQAVG